MKEQNKDKNSSENVSVNADRLGNAKNGAHGTEAKIADVPRRQSSKMIMIIASLIALSISFGFGFSLGQEYTEFQMDADDKYFDNFAKFWPDNNKLSEGSEHEMAELRNSRGHVGIIVDISEKYILISKADDSELIIEVAAKAVIKKNRNKLEISDLHAGDAIAVIGHPEEHEGVFEATLIKVIKVPPILKDKTQQASVDKAAN